MWTKLLAKYGKVAGVYILEKLAPLGWKWVEKKLGKTEEPKDVPKGS